MSFITLVGAKTLDVREFLKEAAYSGGVNYKPRRGEKHQIFIPFVEEMQYDEEGQAIGNIRTIFAIKDKVHDWTNPEGRYKSTICLKNKVIQDENGNLLADGSCPFCERKDDGWDIANYRIEIEKEIASRTKSGKEYEEYIKNISSDYYSQRKVKEAINYAYILIAQFRGTGDNIVMDSQGLPEYDIKIMRVGSGRLEKIMQIIENAGMDLAGSEILFQYPDISDPRAVVSQSTTVPVYGDNKITNKFPKVLEKIQSEASNFEWEGIEKSFPEWEGMTSLAAAKVVTELFKEWDLYKKNKEINPNAKYLEYSGIRNSENPNVDVDKNTQNQAIQNNQVQLPGGQLTQPSGGTVIGATTQNTLDNSPLKNLKTVNIDQVLGASKTPIDI